MSEFIGTIDKYIVYRKSANDIEARSGYTLNKVFECDAFDEAEKFVEEQTDKNGWVSYVIQKP